MPRNAAAAPPPIVILHLSDLHLSDKDFASGGRFHDRKPEGLGKGFGRDILRELKQREPTKEKPDLVVVTGDIAQLAKPKEYEAAHRFFEGLNGELGQERQRYVFLPGNHDVSHNACKRAEQDADENESGEPWLRAEMDKVKFDNFEKFVATFTGKPRNAAARHIANGAFLHDFPDLRLTVAALNSCEIDSHRPPDQKGVVSKAQAEAVMRAFRAPERTAWLKILALHHNPVLADKDLIQKWNAHFEKKTNESGFDKTLFDRYKADTYGVEGKERLNRIAEDHRAQVVLHGHQHADAQSILNWGKGEGMTHVLSAGSLFLPPDKLPGDHPNQVQLVVLDPDPSVGGGPKLRVWLLVYYSRAQRKFDLEPGRLIGDPARSGGAYTQTLYLPEGWVSSVPPCAVRSSDAPGVPDDALVPFVEEYRLKLSGLFTQWELGRTGAVQSGGAVADPLTPKLEDMYVPLRLGEQYNIEKLDEGEWLPPETLLQRQRPLAIRGHAGSGKTTWTRWTFHQLLMREELDALPIMIELRRLAHDWNKENCLGDRCNLTTYMTNWAGMYLGMGWKDRLPSVLKATTGLRPVLFVDGWDELGEVGEQVRAQLVAFMHEHPRALVVVTSRPYGETRPAHGDGFDTLDLQPLNDAEVDRLAENFFTRCFGNELETVRAESLGHFRTALARAPEAQALARTPLLLSMMLIISRSSPLPDKRHQLYHSCIVNLLTTLPKQWEHQGVVTPVRQWRPEDGDERLRVVARLAAEMQEKEYLRRNRQAIVMSFEAIEALLPREWTAQQRSGFVYWLTERAGVLVDRADATYAFAHLSFQEYLTAWWKNANIEGEENRKKEFPEKAGNETWWETLRLWAALEDARKPERLQPVLEGLMQSGDKGVLLAGCLFADGLGTPELFTKWPKQFCSVLDRGMPDGLESCGMAWSASRQTERRQTLIAHLKHHAPTQLLFPWLRSLQWSKRHLGTLIDKPKTGTHSLILLESLSPGYENEAKLHERTWAVGRVLCGVHPFWPGGHEAALLHLWPGQRRHVGLRLQNAANQGAEPSLFDSLAVTSIPIPRIDASHETPKTSFPFTRDFRRFFMNEYIKYIIGHFGQEILEEASDREFLSFVAADFSLSLSIYFGENMSKYLKGQVMDDYDISILSGFLRHPVRFLPSEFSFNCFDSLTGKKCERENRPSDGLHIEYPNWVSDFISLELGLYRVCSLPSLHQNITKGFPLEARLLASAGRLYYNPNHKDTTLHENKLNEYLDLWVEDRGSSGDPLWPALARHIARRTKPGDADWTLLEDLARHPEKRSGPLSWALRYIVRGDVLLEDGTIVELDALAKRLGLEPPPYLEPMPDPIEFGIEP